MKHNKYGQDNTATSPIVGTDIYGQPDVLYGSEAPGQAPIAMSDINQGNIGDCYLCSAMIEEVRKGPQFITNMIKQNPDGTENVRLYVDSTTGQAPTWSTTHFSPIIETVNNANLYPWGVNELSTQALVGGGSQHELWPQVVEQAYAQLRGGIGVIANGGNPALAGAAMSGHQALMIAPNTFNLSSLQHLINAGDCIVFDTLPFGPLTNGLVTDHAYAYNGCTPHAGHGGMDTTLNLKNPWGYNDPAPVKLSALVQNFGDIEAWHP